MKTEGIFLILFPLDPRPSQLHMDQMFHNFTIQGFVMLTRDTMHAFIAIYPFAQEGCSLSGRNNMKGTGWLSVTKGQRGQERTNTC